MSHTVAGSNVDYGGARGSNAGDAFHELWALGQALALLDPDTDLRAITVEGISANQGGKGPRWDSVDCALFFGGEMLETASRIEFVQLKYSASNPTTPWTLARLKASPAGTSNKSVLRRLATDFKRAQAMKHAGAALLVRFVSNQPVDALVTALVLAAQRGSMPSNLQPHFETVVQATGLPASEALNFLAALDVSECGSMSRFTEEEKLILGVANLREDSALLDIANLRQEIARLMLPEHANRRITRATVLSWFGIADIKGLFPCPPYLGQVQQPVIRQVSNEVAQALTQGNRVVCLHGGGGCGKTTAVQQLPEFLPKGSRCVVFDCFGAGRYLATDDRRHLPGNAFLQIANDLARELRTPFFLPRTGEQPVDIRQFLRRVAQAAEVIATTEPTSAAGADHGCGR